MRLLPPLVARARTHARRFPQPVWLLIGVDAVRSFGGGLFVPYWALFLTSTLGASGAQAGALLALAGGVGLVGAPLGGVLSDRIGRRRTLLLALAGSAVWLITYGSLSNLTAIAILTAFGISGDLQGPAVSAAIADVVEPDLRAETYGLRRQADNIAFALGPPLGALLIGLGFSLRWTFLLAGAALVFCFVAVWRLLPETRPERCANEQPPRLREAARDRLLLMLALGTGVGVVVSTQFHAVLGVFLHQERGYAIATWGLVFAINPILIGLVQYPIARWAGRRSARAMLALGMLLQGGALTLLWPTSAVAVLVLAVVILSVGEMILSPIASALAAAIAPPRLRGTYEGIVDLAFAVAWAPATLVGFWLVGRGQGWLMLALALPIAAVGTLCFLPLSDRPVRTEDVLPVSIETPAVP
jgi:MFS family permease